MDSKGHQEEEMKTTNSDCCQSVSLLSALADKLEQRKHAEKSEWPLSDYSRW